MTTKSPSPDDPLGLNRALDFLTADQRRTILDALYCTLHNQGHYLAGNTEDTDLEWFAERLYERCIHGPSAWSAVQHEERERWRYIARMSLLTLPLLMSRVSNRCVAVSQAIKAVLDMDKAAKDQKGGPTP